MAGQLLEVGAERDFAGPRFTPPWRVGNLDVTDPAGVVIYRGGDVVAVDVEVVEVGKQSQVGCTVLGVHPIDHVDGVGGGRDGISWCAAYGFDQYCRADAVRRARGVGKVLGPDLVLGRGRVFLRCGCRKAR